MQKLTILTKCLILYSNLTIPKSMFKVNLLFSEIPQLKNIQLIILDFETNINQILYS